MRSDPCGPPYKCEGRKILTKLIVSSSFLFFSRGKAHFLFTISSSVFPLSNFCDSCGIRSRRMFWGWLLRDFRLLPRILFCFRTSESFVLSVVASLECYNCESQSTPYDCSKNGELVTCAGDESCVRYEINLVENVTLIISHEGCLKSSLCSAYRKGEIDVCINLKEVGIARECKAMCCNEDRCNSVSVLQINVLVLLLGILIAAVSN